MKLILFVPLIFGAVIVVFCQTSQERINKHQADLKFCIDKYAIADYSTNPEYVVPEDKKCFFHCMYEKMGLMDAAGAITIDKYKAMHPNMTQEMINERNACVTETKAVAEPCTRARAINECVKKNHRKEMNKYSEGRMACLKEIGLPSDKWVDIPKDKECFYRCLANAWGIMAENGSLTVERYKTMNTNYTDTKLQNSIGCYNIAGNVTEPCKKAHVMMDCMHHKSWF